MRFEGVIEARTLIMGVVETRTNVNDACEANGLFEVVVRIFVGTADVEMRLDRSNVVCDRTYRQQ